MVRPECHVIGADEVDVGDAEEVKDTAQHRAPKRADAAPPSLLSWTVSERVRRVLSGPFAGKHGMRAQESRFFASV
jgi:hypothetical protein